MKAEKVKAPVKKIHVNGNGHNHDYNNGSAVDTNAILSSDLLNVLREVRNGNFSARMPIDQIGINGKICDTLNEIIELNEKMMLEFNKAEKLIGKQGKL